MRAVDFIVKHIEEQNMTQEEAAAVVGCSRQCLWDKLNKGNPRFHNMLHIITSFGFELHITREDGSEVGFDEKKVLEIASNAKNMYFDSLEDIINAMGYKFLIVEKAE